MGVCFFIMLSGFVMSLGYGNRTMEKDFNFKQYYRKRIIRLWPLHLLCLFIFVIINPNTLSSVKSIANLAINALLLQSWVPIKAVYFSGNSVSWCLSDLMFFYLIFPHLFRNTSKIKGAKFILFSLVLLIVYLFSAKHIPANNVHAFISISPLFRLFDFMLGIIAYRLYAYLSNSDSINIFFHSLDKYILTTVEALIIGLFVLCVVEYPKVPINFSYDSFWWPCCFMCIIMFSLLEKFNCGGCFSRFFQSKWLERASSISFTFYMIHALCIPAFLKILSALPFEIPYFFIVFICLIAIMLLAWVTNTFFEKPLSNYLVKKYEKS